MPIKRTHLVGVEPTTLGLEGPCSSTELQVQSLDPQDYHTPFKMNNKKRGSSISVGVEPDKLHQEESDMKCSFFTTYLGTTDSAYE